MRPIVLLAPLLLIQCGPGAPDADGSTTDGTVTTTGNTTLNTTVDTTDLVTTSTSSDATTTDATTEPTTDATTTAGACHGLRSGSGIVWVCACETNQGPWTPFNEACDKQESGAVEWAEWLCSEYAEDDLGATTGPGTTGDPSTGADTDTLNCQCTCEMTVDCCDDSKP